MITGCPCQKGKCTWYVAQLPSLGTSPQGKSLNGQLEYVYADVTNQTIMWAKAEDIANSEGRLLDICISKAGILRSAECLDYRVYGFRQVFYLSSSGSFFLFLLMMTVYVGWNLKRRQDSHYYKSNMPRLFENRPRQGCRGSSLRPQAKERERCKSARVSRAPRLPR